MRLVPEIMRRGIAFYRMHGFSMFVKAASNYFLREWRFSPYAKGIVLHRGKAGKLKVLYVDMISAPHAKSNVNGRIKAYSKVSTLMTFDDRKLARRYGQSRMNQRLIKAAVKFKPDLIQLGKAESIYGSTIKEIKSQINTCVIHFYGDFRWEIQPYVADIGKYADYTLFYHKEATLINQYEELGVRNAGFWWVGADPDIFYPRGGDKICDIVFMANNPKDSIEGHKIRRVLIDALAEKGFNLHICGNNWEYLSNVPNVHIHPFVDLEKFAKVCSSSKITLGTGGLGANNDAYMYNSWRRTFNSMASGTFHLTHYVPGLEEVFENKKHLVWFNSVPEATELIEYYLAHDEERERIAEAGRQEVLAYHTWDIRIAEMIERAVKWKVKAGLLPPMKPWEIPWETKWSQERIDSTWEWHLREVRKKDKAYSIIAELCARYGNSVIDIGCGGGVKYASMRDVSPEVKYTGIDITPGMLKCAQRLFPEAKFELGDAADLPYSDGEFDVSLVSHVLEHHPLSNGRRILHEALRVTKNAALLLFFIEPQEMEQDIVERQSRGGFYLNTYSKRWIMNEIKDALNNQCSINIISIPKTKDSPALSDQFLYVIEKHGDKGGTSKEHKEEVKPKVKYNLNFDDLLPSYTDFTLLEELVRLFPDIKITIFMPINSRDWGDNQNNILDYPGWCQRVTQLPSKNFEIALHGYYHHLNDPVKTPEFKYLSKEEAINRLLECEEAFQKAGIKYTKGFRPPRWEISRGTERALEELGYLYLSDSPRFYEEHKDIRIPRLFANSDIKENEEYIWEVKPYKKLLLDSKEYYLHRGHLASRLANNLTRDNFNNIVKTIRSFESVEFNFLSEVAQEIREQGREG